jgi:hypothetical protein
MLAARARWDASSTIRASPLQKPLGTVSLSSLSPRHISLALARTLFPPPPSLTLTLSQIQVTRRDGGGDIRDQKHCGRRRNHH